jgi:hypothetical protein
MGHDEVFFPLKLNLYCRILEKDRVISFSGLEGDVFQFLLFTRGPGFFRNRVGYGIARPGFHNIPADNLLLLLYCRREVETGGSSVNPVFRIEEAPVADYNEVSLCLHKSIVKQLS